MSARANAGWSVPIQSKSGRLGSLLPFDPGLLENKASIGAIVRHRVSSVVASTGSKESAHEIGDRVIEHCWGGAVSGNGRA
jgi:hypothetical protein